MSAVILGAGDSLMDYLSSIPATSSSSASRVWNRNTNLAFFDLHTISVNHWIPFYADAYFTMTGNAIDFFNGGISGSHLIGNWDAFGAGTHWDNLKTQWVASGSPSVTLILVILGANDVISGVTRPVSDYVTAIQAMQTYVLSTFTGSPWMYFAFITDAGEFSFTGGAANVDYITRMNNVRQAIFDAEAAGYCKLGASLLGQTYPPADHTHPDDINDAAEIGRGFAAASIPPLVPSPRIVSATYDPVTLKVRGVWNQDLSNTLSSAVGGFEVFDADGTSVPIISQVISDARTALLTPSRAVVGAGSMSFGSARDAAGQVVPRGASQLSGGLFAPAYPFFRMPLTSFTPTAIGGVSASRMQLGM